jgi:hypothetical protein
MIEHLKVLAWLGMARALLGVLFGVFLIWRSLALNMPSLQGAEPWDIPLFQALGCLSILLGDLWLVQGIGVLCRKGWSRRFGLVLGFIDLVSLPFFPVSTAMGLYAVVVYRHGETVEYFRLRGARAAGAAGPLQRAGSPVK